MADRSVSSRRATLPLCLAFSVLLAGCGGDSTDGPATTGPAVTTSTAPATTTTTLATTTTTAAPTTTTTLDADGVLHTFIGYITDPVLTARGDVTMDVSLGELAVSGTGQMELSGAGSHMTIEFPGMPVREVLSVNDVQYERSGDGPWTVDRGSEDPFAEPADPSATPLEDLQFAAFLQTLGDLEHQGTMGDGDQLLHRIGLPEGQQPDPVAFGLEPEDTGAFQVSFLATSAGLPHEFWLQIEDLSDPEGPVSMTLTLRFVEFGIPLAITAPEDVWLTFNSDAGYSISHPSDWDVEAVTRTSDYSEDRLYGLQGEELAIFVTPINPPGRVPLNAWLDAFRSAVEVELGATVGTAEEFEFGALPARRVDYTFGDEFGSAYAIYVVLQTDPRTVFEFIVFGDQATPMKTERLLEDFLSTFATG